jgi:outer membrane protein assembly factor BamB
VSGRWVRFILALFLILVIVQVSSADDLEPPLKVIWTSRLGIISSDITPQSIDLIASDIVYVNYEVLNAIDANDGKLLWSKDWSARLAYRDGVLYAARASSLYALDARTGEEIWRNEYPELKGQGISYLSISNDTLYITTAGGSDNFMVLAADTEGKLKWYQKYNGQTAFGIHPMVTSNVLLVLYGFYSDQNPGQNVIAFDLETGEKIWEIADIGIESSLSVYQDLLFIDKLYENNSHYILAVSQATGETAWKRRVGDSYGNILAIQDDKLFVNSENFMVLNPVNGEILDEYSSTLDPSLLYYFPFVISNHILYVVTTGPSPHIYGVNLSTGELLWEGGKGGISPYFYQNRLYLITFGKLYAYEHGIEEISKAKETSKAVIFSIFAIPLIIANVFLRIKKYNGKLKGGFVSSSLLTLVVYSVFLVYGIPYFINILEISIPSLNAVWNFYLLFPIIGVIAGTLTGTRIKNQFLIGIATGATPYLIALIVSVLFQPDLFKYLILSLNILMISLEIILLIGLIFGAVCTLLNRTLFLKETS